MKKITRCLLITVTMLYSIVVHSQQVAINEDGSLPNPNAILDVKSFTKGVLIPRMSTTQRTAIPNTRGLLVYDSTTNSFWYNDGTVWTNLAPGASASNAWSLTGNDSTTSANFLGTTDAQPLRVKVNNEPAGIITVNSLFNTFWGHRAGGSVTSGNSNTGTGNSALSLNTTGDLNSAFGRGALRLNTTGSENTANGAFALGNNTSGNENTATGRYASFNNLAGHFNTAAGNQTLMANNSGSNNTAIGYTSLRHSTGDFNTAVGSGTLFTLSSGQRNTAVGANALYSTRNGQSNTAVGNHALYFNTSGWLNTAVGNQALYSNSIGNFNTAIGYGADVNSASLSNATAIGFGAIVNLPNKVRIGNSSVFSIEGAVPFSTPSDARFKNEVQEDVKGLDFILQLRPVTYQFDAKFFDEQQRAGMAENKDLVLDKGMEEAYSRATAIRRSGFIAQEVEKAAAASGYNFSGLIKPQDETGHYSISYESFVIPLVKSIQELHAEMEKLKKENETLKKQISNSKL
jgi:trimeric autotransporter adhesin